MLETDSLRRPTCSESSLQQVRTDYTPITTASDATGLLSAPMRTHAHAPASNKRPRPRTCTKISPTLRCQGVSPRGGAEGGRLLLATLYAPLGTKHLVNQCRSQPRPQTTHTTGLEFSPPRSRSRCDRVKVNVGGPHPADGTLDYTRYSTATAAALSATTHSRRRPSDAGDRRARRRQQGSLT